MGIKSHIFLTNQGFTYEPQTRENQEAKEIFNLQVIGFAKGNTAQEAFEALQIECDYLNFTGFNSFFSYPLNELDYENTKIYHVL